jgi:hypothetical protein
MKPRKPIWACGEGEKGEMLIDFEACSLSFAELLMIFSHIFSGHQRAAVAAAQKKCSKRIAASACAEFI